MTALRIGVDAFNLAADRRGMGRLVRMTLEALEATGEVQVTHVTRKPDAHSIAPRDLPRARLDAVWYPWNGMRFAPHAPSVVSINDPFAFTYPHRDFVARWREQAPIRRAIRQADRILTISKWGAAQLERLFHVDAARLLTVYPAPDPFWHPAGPREDAAPYMLFVAGPDARKNAAMLFAAYDAAFAHGGPQLVVAGALSSADERALHEMRAPVRRAAPSDEELCELYSGALAVLVPSLAEGFGLPVVEAMACGAPVVASDASALPEAAEHAALLVGATDTDAWAQTLQGVAANAQLRAQLRELGFARVKKLEPDAIARALIELARRFRADAR